MFHDGFEHFPARFLPGAITRQSVHDEDGFDGFGAELVGRIVNADISGV